MSIEKAIGRRGTWRWNKETEQFEEVIKKAVQVNAPAVITDEIPPTLSMTGTDNVYTSKARLRAEYKAMGFVETGGEILPMAQPDREKRRREIRETVEKALNDNKYGMAPISEREREIVKEEERVWNNYKNR